MNMLHVSTYVAGAGMVVFGFVGLVMGWTDQTSAIALIMSGLTTFGITHQNVQLGKAIGKY